MRYIIQKVTMAIIFQLAIIRFYIAYSRNGNMSALCLYYAFVSTIYTRELDKIKPSNSVHEIHILKSVMRDVNSHDAKLATLGDEQILVLCKILKYEMVPLIKSYIRGKINILRLYNTFGYYLLDDESPYKEQLLKLGVNKETLESINGYLYSTIRHIRYTASVQRFQQVTAVFSQNVLKFSKPFNLMA